MTALKSLAHRFCRATRKQLVLSHQYFVSCDIFNRGCNGGNEKSVFYYLEQHGVPSDECVPWQSIKEPTDDLCHKCYNNRPMKFFRAKKGSTKHYIGIDNIKKGIMLEGPISTSLISDYNFVWYRDGLYTSYYDASSSYNDLGNHTVEIHGWGTFENGTQYWLVQNAFGVIWGQNGMMKMVLGRDEGYIERGMIAAEPDLTTLYNEYDL